MHSLQGVTEVVRGCDLLSSTPRQILLQRALGFRTPRYAHLPLLAESDGRAQAGTAGGTRARGGAGDMGLGAAQLAPGTADRLP